MQQDINDLKAAIADLEAQQKQAEQTYYQVEGALKLARALYAKKLNAKAALDASTSVQLPPSPHPITSSTE